MFDTEYPGSKLKKDSKLPAFIQYLIDKRMAEIEKNIEKLISKGLDKDKPKEKV